MQNPDLIKMRDQLEYMFLRVIVSGLRNGTLHAPEVKTLAQEFLNVEPFASPEDAHNKINQFVITHSGFNLLKEYADIYYDEDRLDEKLIAMRQHLKSNNIDGALNVLNK